MAVRKITGSVCEKCENPRANVYQRNLPREVRMCFECWKHFVYARALRSALWQTNAKEFLQGYLAGIISPFPDDINFRRRYSIRELIRFRTMRIRQRRSAEIAWRARESGVAFASELLGEPVEKLKKIILIADVSPGISSIETRIQKLLDMDPVYTRYLKNIRGPGVAINGLVMGEIGVARTLLCFQHELRARVFSCCEHGKLEDIDEATLVSKPNQRVYGISCFPSTAELHSFFGITFSNSGATIYNAFDSSEEPWFLASSNIVGKVGVSTHRKTVIVVHLGGVLEKIRKEDIQHTPFAQIMQQEKVDKLEQWRVRYEKYPPNVCTNCHTHGCEKCSGKGQWQKPKSDGAGLWVCQCHKNGYWFGSPAHIRMHAFRKTGTRFLDSLFHAWQYIEGVGPEPYLDLTRSHLS